MEVSDGARMWGFGLGDTVVALNLSSGTECAYASHVYRPKYDIFVGVCQAHREYPLAAARSWSHPFGRHLLGHTS